MHIDAQVSSRVTFPICANIAARQPAGDIGEYLHRIEPPQPPAWCMAMICTAPSAPSSGITHRAGQHSASPLPQHGRQERCRRKPLVYPCPQPCGEWRSSPQALTRMQACRDDRNRSANGSADSCTTSCVCYRRVRIRPECAPCPICENQRATVIVGDL
jgi:hypothetical protein